MPAIYSSSKTYGNNYYNPTFIKLENHLHKGVEEPVKNTGIDDGNDDGNDDGKPHKPRHYCVFLFIFLMILAGIGIFLLMNFLAKKGKHLQISIMVGYIN